MNDGKKLDNELEDDEDDNQFGFDDAESEGIKDKAAGVGTGFGIRGAAFAG